MILGSCCDVNEIRHLLGFYTAKIGSFLLMFQDNLLMPSSRVKQYKKNAAQLHRKVIESGGLMFPQTSSSEYSIGNPLPSSPSLSEFPLIH
jgi:hypothetical protein